MQSDQMQSDRRNTYGETDQGESQAETDREKVEEERQKEKHRPRSRNAEGRMKTCRQTDTNLNRYGTSKYLLLPWNIAMMLLLFWGGVIIFMMMVVVPTFANEVPLRGIVFRQ